MTKKELILQFSRALFASFLILVLWPMLSIRISNARDNQKFRFSDDLTKFPAELSTLLQKEEGVPDKQLIIKKFEKFWTIDSVLTDDQKSKVIVLSNLLLDKVSQNYQYQLTYAKVLMAFFASEYSKKQYDVWEKGFEKLVTDSDSKISMVDDLLKNTLDIISGNTIFNSSGFSWRVNRQAFRFFLKNDNLEVKYDTVTLTCTNRKDSISINNTSGIYSLNTKMWTGKKGKVFWSRSKYPEDEIFAELNRYRINMVQNTYAADSAYFTNKDYFTKPSLGTLTDKLIKDYTPDNIPYPEFQSYDRWFNIKNLFPDVDYEGGFVMKGSRLIGTGSNEKLATIRIKKNKKEFLKVEGNILIFQRQVLNSDKASIRFKFEKDSIYHPGLNFNYNDKNKTVTISANDKLLSQSPYSSTFHKLSITAQQLRWKIDEDKIYFSAPTGSNLGRATFESNNFFNQENFDRMMGPDEQHPLLMVAKYANKVKSKFFIAEDIAKFVKKPIEQVRIEMMRIAMQGYIFYNFETDEIQLTPKLSDAIRARGQLIDYDVINFSSQTPGNVPNAVLDIKSMDLMVNGVENISVSDSQNVRIYPANNQIVMQNNRNFYFAGVVRAGLFTYYGKKFQFDYDNFKLALDDVDSLNLDFKTNDFDMYGRKVLQNITSTFEKIKGDILIDKPDNKSGIKDNPEYPIFNSLQKSFIYYDNIAIHNGVYKRDSFYFEVYPFRFTNLNNFEQSNLNFRGILYSANIIAPIEESLKLRPDNSLGFVNTAPPEGYAMYQGKGRIFNKIDLSNQGFRADGEIKYITSTTASNDFYLFPDSMVTLSSSFDIGKQVAGIEYPKTVGGIHKIKWQPKQERMKIRQGMQPFEMYEGQAKLSGDLILGPLGLIGDGTLSMENAKMFSSKYEFNADDVYTDIASLDLFTPETDQIAFTSKNLKAKVDFKEQVGHFTKNEESIFARMDPLKYEVFLDKFDWSMSNDELTMATPTRQKAVEMQKFHVSNMVDRDTIPSGSLYYSTKFDEDSLYFFSPKAKYSLRTSELNADSVKYLIVADAKIIAPKNKINVKPQTRILPLSGALIFANLKNKFHKIYNSDITIAGRKKYFGKGYYDYIDEADSTQTIVFNELKVDSSLNTTAITTLTEPDRFMLSPNFAYIGKVTLNAPQKFLTFNGGVKPVLSCPRFKPSWLKFQSVINPDSIFIPVDEVPFNLNQVRLINGSIIRLDSLRLYGSFFDSRKDYEDVPISLASGFLTFNKLNRRFIIAPSHKILFPDSTGNSVSLQKDYCWMFGEGKLNLPYNLGQVKLVPTGSLIHRLEENLLTLDLILQINFHMNQSSLEAMAADINSNIMLEGVDLKRKIYRKTLYERLTPRDAAIALNQINLFGAMSQTPKDFESTITLAEVKLRWNPKTRSLISVGKLGIGTIGNIQVNKKVNGYLEIVKRRSGDFMTLYFHLGDTKYYVFTYTKGSMQVSSDNLAFVNPILAQKASERRVKVPLGQQKYYYSVGTNRELNMARQRYKQLQDGVDSSDILDEMDKMDDNSDKKAEKSETKVGGGN